MHSNVCTLIYYIKSVVPRRHWSTQMRWDGRTAETTGRYHSFRALLFVEDYSYTMAMLVNIIIIILDSLNIKGMDCNITN